MGVETPLGKITDEKMIKQHNKKRMNTEAIKASIEYHSDYHVKPVWGGSDYVELKEITDYIEELGVDHDKVYWMPAGGTREQLFVSYPLVFNWVRDNGYRMTFRAHIMAFEDAREV